MSLFTAQHTCCPKKAAAHINFMYLLNPYSAGINFRYQILASKVNTRTVQIFIMNIDAKPRYSNEAERAGLEIYDDFKF